MLKAAAGWIKGESLRVILPLIKSSMAGQGLRPSLTISLGSRAGKNIVTVLGIVYVDNLYTVLNA